jgi:hypothetical protein
MQKNTYLMEPAVNRPCIIGHDVKGGRFQTAADVSQGFTNWLWQESSGRDRGHHIMGSRCNLTV